MQREPNVFLQLQ